MYHKHNTEGIVIKGMDKGDSSRVLVLLTRDFGLIYVTVQNARSESSKLRYGIQDFTLGHFSLVRGRHSWKLVGIGQNRNIFTSLKGGQNIRTIYNVFSLLKKIAGEEKNEKLFNSVSVFIDFVLENKSEEVKNSEILTVLRILDNLGYLGASKDFIDCLQTQNITSLETNIIKDKKREAISMINSSLETIGVI